MYAKILFVTLQIIKQPTHLSWDFHHLETIHFAINQNVLCCNNVWGPQDSLVNLMGSIITSSFKSNFHSVDENNQLILLPTPSLIVNRYRFCNNNKNRFSVHRSVLFFLLILFLLFFCKRDTKKEIHTGTSTNKRI